MRSTRNNLLIILTLVLGLTLNNVVLANSVEFGQDATGDPNAVKVGGASGFLYSERIVFTAAHVIGAENPGAIAYWEREGVIYTPGISRIEGQKKYKVKKVLVAPTYRPRVGQDQTRIDDFAIVILQESIPMKNEVVVATSDNINLFIKNKAPVSMIGYGLQNPSQRTNPEWGNLSPMKMTSYLISNEELRDYVRNNSQRIPPNQTILDYGVPNSEKFGSVCDGDSGAGFFVEEGDTRYYLGAVGGQQAAIPNCQSASWATFGIGGGMSGITAANKFLDLIKTAEQIVEEDKKIDAAAAAATAEMREKLEAEAKRKAAVSKKTTIKCVKGNMTQKVTAISPKCPRGFKKI